MRMIWKRRTPSVKWLKQAKLVLTRSWREKLVALVLAILFWYMIKAQIRRQVVPWMTPPSPVAQMPSL